MNVVILDSDMASRSTLSLYFDSGFGLDTIEFEDFSSFRSAFKDSLDMSVLVITSDFSDSFLDLADCLSSMERKIPVLLFRNKVINSKYLDMIEENCLYLQKLSLPFVEYEFLEVMEEVSEEIKKNELGLTENLADEIDDDFEIPEDGIIGTTDHETNDDEDDFVMPDDGTIGTSEHETNLDKDEIKKPSDSQQNDNFSTQSDIKGSRTDEEDFYTKTPRGEKEEVDAGYSLKRERKEYQEVDADYSLNQSKTPQVEVEADYSLKKEYNNQGEVEADYSLKKEYNNQGEVEADYSLKQESNSQEEVEADYSLKQESTSQEEVEADYSLKRDSGPYADDNSEEAIIKKQKKRQGIKNKFDSLNKESVADRKLNDDISEKFVFVKIQKLLIKNQYPFDVYVRLSPRKIVKLITENDTFEPNDILKYEKRGITHLLIPSDKLSLFQELLISEVMKKASQKDLNDLTSIKGMIVVSSNLDDYIKSMGITPFAIKAVEKQRKETVKALEKNKNLADLLGAAMNGNIYLQEHGMLCSIIATEICKNMAWSSDKILQKMHFVSVLHDISLHEGRLAEIHNPKEDGVTEEEKKLVLAHPAESSRIVSEADDLPPDIDTMILQHHEKPDGTGFPGGLKALSISPLSCVFIIAEKIVKEIYGKTLNKEEIYAIINNFDESFNRGNFKKPFQAAKASFK